MSTAANSIVIRAELVADARACDARIELAAIATTMKRSLGQRARWHLVQWKRDRSEAQP